MEWSPFPVSVYIIRIFRFIMSCFIAWRPWAFFSDGIPFAFRASNLCSYPDADARSLLFAFKATSLDPVFPSPVWALNVLVVSGSSVSPFPWFLCGTTFQIWHFFSLRSYLVPDGW